MTGQIQNILAQAVLKGASDVHINYGIPPVMRINTELVKMDYEPVATEDAEAMLASIIGTEALAKLKKNKDIDFSTTIENPSQRFRVNAHYQRDTVAISFRLVPDSVPKIEELNLPAIIKQFADLPRGLILLTGHTGAGKSTTLAVLLSMINEKHRKRIITLEDPIEYWLENKKCMIEQREVGSDCPDFASGLRHVLRQDPDVIAVGEMRDLETTSFTITSAETGHLVFSTLHTINASQTIERVIDIYPANQQDQIRMMLANTLQAVLTQTLFRRIDRPGMVPATELLLCNSAVRNCIRENRIYELPNIIETSRQIGMHTMDYSITKLCAQGWIDKEQAISHATNPRKMALKLGYKY
jgi:twitching motility protein PilT